MSILSPFDPTYGGEGESIPCGGEDECIPQPKVMELVRSIEGTSYSPSGGAHASFTSLRSYFLGPRHGPVPRSQVEGSVGPSCLSKKGSLEDMVSEL